MNWGDSALGAAFGAFLMLVVVVSHPEWGTWRRVGLLVAMMGSFYAGMAIFINNMAAA